MGVSLVLVAVEIEQFDRDQLLNEGVGRFRSRCQLFYEQTEQRCDSSSVSIVKINAESMNTLLHLPRSSLSLSSKSESGVSSSRSLRKVLTIVVMEQFEIITEEFHNA